MKSMNTRIKNRLFTKATLFFIIIQFLFITNAAFATLHSKPNDEFELTIKNIPPNIKVLGIGEAYFQKGYISSTIEKDESKVINGECKFKGLVVYPTAFRIFSLQGDIQFNQLLFLGTGKQEITLSMDKKNCFIIKRPNSQLEIEYQNFSNFLDIKSLDDQLPIKKLFKYSQTHKTSYVLLYSIINHTFNHFYELQFSKILKSLDTVLISTKAFQYYKSQYLTRKSLIPLEFLDSSGLKSIINFKDHEYTFVELWFLGCTGCVQRINKIKDSIELFQKKIKFVSLNTGAENSVNDSQVFIKKMQWPMDHYFDYDALKINKLYDVVNYPSNLLVNSDGVVIARDIDVFSPEWRQFLGILK